MGDLKARINLPCFIWKANTSHLHLLFINMCDHTIDVKFQESK